jgi:hypothetical protein
MAVYGSAEGVRRLVQATEGDDFGTDMQQRMDELLPVVSALIEYETGAVFAASPTAQARLVEGVPYDTTLYLPTGLYSLTSIVAAPEWDGAAWTGGTTLASTDYRLAGRNQYGLYRTIRGVAVSWSGTYLITGVWEDQVNGVPPEIHYVANYAAAEIFKKQNASPAGFAGPDGSVVLFRDVFRETEVRKILEKHRVGLGVWF